MAVANGAACEGGANEWSLMTKVKATLNLNVKPFQIFWASQFSMVRKRKRRSSMAVLLTRESSTLELSQLASKKSLIGRGSLFILQNKQPPCYHPLLVVFMPKPPWLADPSKQRMPVEGPPSRFPRTSPRKRPL